MSIMNESCKVFPSGGLVPTTSLSTLPLIPNQLATVSVPQQVIDPGPNPPVTYQFLYWVINGVLQPPGINNNSASFDVPSNDFDATAWYLPLTGGPGTGVWTYAFSPNKNEVISGATPIASVNPSGAWPVPGQPNTFVAVSSSPVSITALPLLTPYGRFQGWFGLWGELAISGSNRTMTAPAKSGNGAVAFYAIPVPDPCQDIRDELLNISLGDFPTPADYAKAKEQLIQKLVACEEKYGELNLPQK